MAAEAGAVVELPDRPAGLLLAAAPGVAVDLLGALADIGVIVP